MSELIKLKIYTSDGALLELVMSSDQNSIEYGFPIPVVAEISMVKMERITDKEIKQNET